MRHLSSCLMKCVIYPLLCLEVRRLKDVVHLEARRLRNGVHLEVRSLRNCGKAVLYEKNHEKRRSIRKDIYDISKDNGANQERT